MRCAQVANNALEGPSGSREHYIKTVLGVALLVLGALHLIVEKYTMLNIYSMSKFLVNPEEELDISFWIDCFIACGSITIRPGSSLYVTSIKLTDSSGRPVHLQVRVQQKHGKALKVQIITNFQFLLYKRGKDLKKYNKKIIKKTTFILLSHIVSEKAHSILPKFSILAILMALWKHPSYPSSCERIRGFLFKRCCYSRKSVEI